MVFIQRHQGVENWSQSTHDTSKKSVSASVSEKHQLRSEASGQDLFLRSSALPLAGVEYGMVK